MMMDRRDCLVTLLTLLGTCVWTTSPQVHAEGPSFASQVRPLLSDRCFKCHGPGAAQGEMGLDQRERAIHVLNPDQPEDSEFLARISSDDPDMRMPPDGKSKPLTPEEINVLSDWIRAGAEYQTHWAYLKPLRPEVPKDQAAIDYFVRQRLSQTELTPSPSESPDVLLRRLSLDLVGLPPSIEEIEAFCQDPSDQAYEAHVDRLLASPQFGEKWARWWLDLARYADSNGYQHDKLRTVWPYRDWVIRAFNDDMPFDQFTIEQLAGDLLPNATLGQKIATGFHRNAPANLAGDAIREEVEAQIKMDRVSTTGLVWLGATLECAQCHDHKFDPIRQADYYQIYAFFNQSAPEIGENDLGGGKSLIGPEIEIPLSPGQAERLRELRQQAQHLEAELERVRPLAHADREAWEQRFLAEKRKDQIDWKKLPYFARAAHKLVGIPREDRTEKSEHKLLFLLEYDHEVTREFAQPLQEIRNQIEQIRPVRSLAMANALTPRQTFIFQRGSYLSPGEEVLPDGILSLHPMPSEFPRNRLGLAQWIVSPENPLTARVTVNRLWAEIFGRGIVRTLEDFGLQSEAPTHPELLDWLAVEFMEQGWSVKQLVKTLVVSETYRQSSRSSPERKNVDPDNRLLSHMSRVRLPAELIRDNTLAISGLLSTNLYGPPIYPPQPKNHWNEIIGVIDANYPVSQGENRYRRGVYVVLRRGNINPSLGNFDATDRGLCVVRRDSTNTPLQALTLLNDPVFVEAAGAFASRIEATKGDVEQKVREGFRVAVSREPTSRELAILTELYHDSVHWFDVAQAILNLDETITKP